uniref:Uncharacterized protein n=1 Tax=Propithecus coquereli TaxID=379532 RepID=A0A2K6F4K7_PROCO
TPPRVGRIRPRPGFGRGVVATLETLPGRPGGPRRDSQVPTRAGPGWAGDLGSPCGERGSGFRNSLQEPAWGWAGAGTSG